MTADEFFYFFFYFLKNRKNGKGQIRGKWHFFGYREGRQGEEGF